MLRWRRWAAWLIGMCGAVTSKGLQDRGCKSAAPHPVVPQEALAGAAAATDSFLLLRLRCQCRWWRQTKRRCMPIPWPLLLPCC